MSETTLQLVVARACRVLYQLKFVIDEPADLDEVVEYLRELPQASADRVWLMPQGISADELATRTKWLC